MVYQQSTKVYCCCGQYIVPTEAVKDQKIVCPRCGQVQTKPVENPAVLIVKRV